MSLSDFQQRLRQSACDLGLGRVSLGEIVFDLDAWKLATSETLSEKGLRDIATTTLQAMVAISVVDSLLEGVGVDVLNGTLHDLLVALATDAAGVGDAAGLLAMVGAIADHGAVAADAAAGAMDAADAAMHVATGGLTLLTSVAASYFVGRYVESKKADRQTRAAGLAVEAARREAYQTLRTQLTASSTSPKELSTPILVLLKAGDLPTSLV